jgi:uncharacterized membrane protein YqjE
MDTAADRGPGPNLNPGSQSTIPPSQGAAAARVDAAAQEASFLEPFERVFASLRRMMSNYATLAVLDVRRAAVQFAWLIGAGIFATVLLVTAWLAAVVALAVWLFGEGMSWPAVLLIAALLNIAGAAFIGWRVKHMFAHTPFSATLRQMRSDHGNAAAGSSSGSTSP